MAGRYQAADVRVIPTKWSDEDVVVQGIGFPKWFEAQLTHTAWPAAVTVRVNIDNDGQPVIVGLEIDPDSGLSFKAAGDLVASIRDIDSVLAEARTAALSYRYFYKSGEQTTPPEDRTALENAIMTIVRRTALDAARPQRRRVLTSDLLNEVAQVYRRALADGEPPTKTVAAEFVVSLRTAARWVSEARKTGALGAALGTRAGEAVNEAGDDVTDTKDGS